MSSIRSSDIKDSARVVTGVLWLCIVSSGGAFGVGRVSAFGGFVSALGVARNSGFNNSPVALEVQSGVFDLMILDPLAVRSIVNVRFVRLIDVNVGCNPGVALLLDRAEPGRGDGLNRIVGSVMVVAALKASSFLGDLLFRLRGGRDRKLLFVVNDGCPAVPVPLARLDSPVC